MIQDFEDSLNILENILMGSDFAWWEWDIAYNAVTTNDLKVSMLGYDPSDFRNKGYEAYTDLLHPEDYERTMGAMRDYLSGTKPIYQVDYRIKKADGIYTWYMDRGAAIKQDGNGEPLILRGIVIDLGDELQKRTKDKAFIDLVRQSLPGPENPSNIPTLCSACKRLKIENRMWRQVGALFEKAFAYRVSHGICPDCIKRLYPEIAQEMELESI